MKGDIYTSDAYNNVNIHISDPPFKSSSYSFEHFRHKRRIERNILLVTNCYVNYNRIRVNINTGKQMKQWGFSKIRSMNRKLFFFSKSFFFLIRTKTKVEKNQSQSRLTSKFFMEYISELIPPESFIFFAVVRYTKQFHVEIHRTI